MLTTVVVVSLVHLLRLCCNVVIGVFTCKLDLMIMTTVVCMPVYVCVCVCLCV